jgi:hypothetical protein
MKSLKKFWRIKVYVPLDDDPREVSLDRIRAKADQRVKEVLKAMNGVAGAGHVGNYDNIFECDVGFEGYRAEKGAFPRYGAVGKDIMLGRIAVISFIDYNVSADILESIVEAVRAVHPWEHPIIEFTECLLYVPTERRSLQDPDSLT